MCVWVRHSTGAMVVGWSRAARPMLKGEYKELLVCMCVEEGEEEGVERYREVLATTSRVRSRAAWAAHRGDQ